MQTQFYTGFATTTKRVRDAIRCAAVHATCAQTFGAWMSQTFRAFDCVHDVVRRRSIVGCFGGFMHLTIAVLLALIAFVLVLVHAIMGKVPLWIPVLLLCLIPIVSVFA